LVDRGYNVDFVGTQYGVADGTPDKTDFDQDHEGHLGWTTLDGVGNVDAIAANTQPDIVLLDLGANDVNEGIPWEASIDNLRTMIEHFRALNPHVIILLAEPTPYSGEDKRAMAKLKGGIARLARAENQRDSQVRAVNLGGFSVRRDTYDGVHPDESGEQKIAKRFYAVVRKYLRRSA
jgi:lysophospholipase L1-like esterase